MKTLHNPGRGQAERRRHAHRAKRLNESIRLALILFLFLFGTKGAKAQIQSAMAGGDSDPEVQAPCLYLEINDLSPSIQGGFHINGAVRTQSSQTYDYGDWFTNTYSCSGASIPGPTRLGIIADIPAPSCLTANTTYVQRMAVPPLTTVTLPVVNPGITETVVLYDAVAARDEHSAGSQIDGSIFAGTSDKNGDNTATWTPGTGSIPQKVDIIDVGGHLRQHIVTDAGGTVLTDELIAVAFATTRNVSGDAHIDFEIFREDLETSSTGFINGGPDAGHTATRFNSMAGQNPASYVPVLNTAGDILVSVDYGNGGTVACGSVWIWVNPNNLDGAGTTLTQFNNFINGPYEFIPGDFFSGTAASPYGYARVMPKNYIPGVTPEFLHASINAAATTLGPTWGSLTAQNAAYNDFIQPLQLAEISLNFTRLGLITSNLITSDSCSNILGSLLVKTRSSNSVTSEMKDFAGPYLFGVKRQAVANAGPDQTLACQTTQVTLNGTTPTGPNPGKRWYEVSNPSITLSTSDDLVVTQAGCYVFEVTSPFLINCIARDTACVFGTPDTIPPAITCPTGASVSCLNQIPSPATTLAAFIAQGGTISGLAPGEGTISHSDSPAPPYNPCGGSFTRTYTIADSCGNASTCTQQISINDNIDPVITGPGDLTIQQCNPSITPGNPNDASATDDCGSVTVTLLPDVITGTCLKTLTRTWRATDACGNTADHIQVITYRTDSQAPVISATCPGGNLGCNPTNAQINAALGTATVTDNCDNNLTATFQDQTTNNGCSFTRTRTWNASDLCGNAAAPVTCSVTYKVDTQAPVIAVNCNGGNIGCNPSATQINAALGTASVTDNCDNNLNATFQDQTTGGPCTFTRTRTWNVSDLCGNAATPASCTVTYKIDTIAPVINANCPGGNLGCNPTNAQINAALGTATVTDNCDNGLTATFQDQTTGGPCNFTRTRTWSAVDLCGNTATTVTCSVSYTVDTTPPVVSCNVPNGSITVCQGSPVTINPTATDNCSGTLTASCSPSGPYPLGTTTVTCSATDACGNIGTCTVTVTVIPNPICVIVPDTTPFCGSPGNTLSATVTGTVGAPGTTTYSWSASNPSYVITAGNGTTAITYTAGSGINTFTLTVTNSQNAVNCSSTCSITDSCINATVCSYTQGYYGNAGGNNCTGQNTTHLLNQILTAGPVTIGIPANNRSITFNLGDEISCIYQRLPGGGPSAVLGAATDCATAAGIQLKGNGSFRNVLLAQTTTLAFNIRVPFSGLGVIQITGPYLMTYESTTGTCDGIGYGTAVPNTAIVRAIPISVVNYMSLIGRNTVADLKALADTALGTDPANLPAGFPSLSALSAAAAAFNEGFDECRVLGAFFQSNPLDTVSNTTTTRSLDPANPVNVTAYPNPASSIAHIEFILNGYDSDVTLELFDLTGKRVDLLFSAIAEGDIQYRVQVETGHLPAGVYTYRLTTAKGIFNDRITIVKN